MKSKNCIIIGLATVMALLTFVGCSTSNTNSTDLMTSSLAAKKPGEVNTLQLGPTAEGGYVGTPGTNGSCPGVYYGCALITNSATGTQWFTPPTGTTNAVVTDISGFPSPYTSVIKVTRKDLVSWCSNNTVSFPASSSKQYKFAVYVTSETPPPTNGQVLTLDVQWNP